MGIFAAKKEIGPDTVLQRRNDLLFNEIDGEVVLLSIENGEYYGMDKVGSRIWELLANPMSLNALVTTLISEFNVNYQKCFEETLEFLKTSISKNLILIA
jgi:hypothetical protein